VSTLLIGTSIAMMLYLLAAGLTLIFGLLGIVNFAHGSFYMLGAFIGYQTVQWTNNLWLALLIAPVVVGVVGAVFEMVAIRPIYRREHHLQFLLTFGAVLVLDEGARILWGVGYKAVEAPPILRGSIELLGSSISLYRIFVIGLGLLVAFLLSVAISGTRLGMVVRAASNNPDMTECLGVNVRRVRTQIFFAGTALAGFAGVIAAPMFPVIPGMGLSVILDCFIVVVIGSLGNLQGAFVGALLIGITRAYGQQYAPEWIAILSYVLFLLILLVRPEGIFARRGRKA
jgi:branched-chain amino acid transport system permease protein